MENRFDRITHLVTIQKTTGRKLKNKNVLLLALGADPEIPEGFEIPFKKTADYLQMNYRGCAYFSTGGKYSDKKKSESRQTLLKILEKTQNPGHLRSPGFYL